ncbi:exonuclease domain-containing protein [Paraglaciecola sp. MB-3u-78]|uniref:exonuclease domain-containing protein n=1 Tax=Paraglaciecola sp. MB-3u-78 TaxID=2058332 RepID=UPI000C33CEBA|nr:exonuclease domain-containing protein [Paraglaciecola sp. MB-3u-78]PKG99414.1 3'-5' exonuclease [Paraglaciecola sp. MB-3u-78]
MRNYPKALPEKYYLDHFNEFIHFITQQCGHLLDKEHQKFMKCYQQLAHDTQCMFVRVINRQGCFITLDKMYYHEINNCQSQLVALQKVNFLRRLKPEDIQGWLQQLTKIQLLEILEQYAVSGIKKSATRQVLLEQVIHSCTNNQCLSSELAQKVLVKNFEYCLAYLLFLFFGNTSSGLNKFSMRDLGVLKTRSGTSEQNARFNKLEQGKCVFYYSFKLEQLKRNELNIKEYVLNNKGPVEHPVIIINCAQCNQLRDEFFYVLGKQLLVQSLALALKYLSASSHPKAQEKWLRELFKLGEKDRVKQELEYLIDNSLDDALLLFAEDFYQRKFHQVKVSKLTKKLRDDSYNLAIDLIHKDQVEKGVKQCYQRLGSVVFRTENRLFNALFGLSFWQELFNDADSVATEFDRRPKVVKENMIYQTLENAIEQRLLMFSESKRATAYLTKIATQYYGQPNGMFRWNPHMIQIISTFLIAAPVEAVVQHLRAMAKNYHGLNDGYPDLMIIENEQLRFEEVKAPGDVIRPNQFVTMNALQDAGFDVRICRVEWFVDPMQPYVVVDVETTGGKQPQHRITEIGAVKMINGEIVERWSSLINPQRHISSFITKLTGISNDMVKDAPLFSEVADSLSQFMENCVFVAHNVNFDYGFFKQEYQRLDRNFVMPKLCTVREMRKQFPGLRSYSLGNLCETFDISLENHHRALCDAEAAAVLLKMVHQQKITIGK